MSRKQAPKSVERFGHYVPNGELLYFLTNDGASFLVTSYETIEQCCVAAIDFNCRIGYLPQSQCGETFIENSGVSL